MSNQNKIFFKIVFLLMITVFMVSCGNRVSKDPQEEQFEKYIELGKKDPSTKEIIKKYETVDIELLKPGKNKEKVINEISEILLITHDEAKRIVDSAPCIIKAEISRAEAEIIGEKLEKLGAKIKIKLRK